MTSNPDPTWTPPLTEAQFTDQYDEDSSLLFQRLSQLVANQRAQRDQARAQVANLTVERDAAIAVQRAAENQASAIPELEQHIVGLEQQLTELRQLNALLAAQPTPPAAPAAPPRHVRFEAPPPPVAPPPEAPLVAPPIVLPVAPPAVSATPRFEEVPDPPKFDGKREELCPFVTQPRLKMIANHDRFPAAQARLAYSINLLSGRVSRSRLLHLASRQGAFGTGLLDRIG